MEFFREKTPLPLTDFLCTGQRAATGATDASGGRLTTQEGSVYPVLYRLLEQSLISDRRGQVGKRMTRIYYHPEPSGGARLQELIREYQEVTQGHCAMPPVLLITKHSYLDLYFQVYPQFAPRDTGQGVRFRIGQCPGAASNIMGVSRAVELAGRGIRPLRVRS